MSLELLDEVTPSPEVIARQLAYDKWLASQDSGDKPQLPPEWESGK